MKVLFLDRDGIINIERGDYTWLREHFVFTTNLFDFLRKARDKGYQFIVVTNQGGIEKGLYSKAHVEELHEFMIEKLKEEKIDILDVFYCPHHDIFQKCICRKPNSQLFEKAIATYGIDVNESLMLGDNQRDVDAGEGAGIKGILISKNPDWKTIQLELN